MEFMVSKRIREVARRTADVAGSGSHGRDWVFILGWLIWFARMEKARLVVRSVWFPTLASQSARR
jgi:hypothetical protein